MFWLAAWLGMRGVWQKRELPEVILECGVIAARRRFGFQIQETLARGQEGWFTPAIEFHESRAGASRPSGLRDHGGAFHR